MGRRIQNLKIQIQGTGKASTRHFFNSLLRFPGTDGCRRSRSSPDSHRFPISSAVRGLGHTAPIRASYGVPGGEEGQICEVRPRLVGVPGVGEVGGARVKKQHFLRE